MPLSPPEGSPLHHPLFHSSIPYTPKILLHVLQWTGLLSLPFYYQRPLYNTLHRVVYRSIVHMFCAAALFSNFVAVLVFSIKDTNEFLSKCIESLSGTLMYFDVLVYNVYAKELVQMIQYMETFSTHEFIFFSFLSAIFFALIGRVLMTFTPLSQSEAETMTLVYNMKQPQNRLYMAMYIPYTDLTEDRFYKVAYGFQLVVLCWVLVLALTAATFSQTVLLNVNGHINPYLRGTGYRLSGCQPRSTLLNNFVHSLQVLLNVYAQHEVFSKHLIRTGRLYQHKSNEMKIFTDLWKYQYHTLGEVKLKRGIGAEVLDVMYMRQLIIFHQKMNIFYKKFYLVFGPVLDVKTVGNLLLLSLCVYQVTQLHSITDERFMKVTGDFLCTVAFYYYICYASERLASATSHNRASLYQSLWYRLPRPGRQCAALFLLRTQVPGYLRCLRGLVTIGHIHFLRDVRNSYSFVNFMRIKDTT
ncbi:hypothetical protein M8J75_013698 [Diaphorina citri]|nr:hypothetical protein M8J75_013698 [Diaphorina citri]